jgi:hypothetical protein
MPLTRGAIEIVIAVGDADPQWPHVDVLTVGKLQVLVYLNGVQVATQLARYAGDPVQWGLSGRSRRTQPTATATASVSIGRGESR